MRKITSVQDFCSRVKNRTVKPLRKEVYKRHEENHHAGTSSVAHVTYYKVGNAGDTVLSQCVRKTLQQLCGITSYDLIEVNEPVTDSVIEKINSSRLLVIGGGGLFLPDTNENAVSGWQWAIPEDKLEEIKVPIILYTVGYNYFRGQKREALFEKNLKLIISKSNFVGLRNNGSCRAVREILSTDSDIVYPEIRYQPCTTTLIRRIYTRLPEKEKTGNIALNVAFDRVDLRLGEDKEIIFTQIASAMRELELRGYKINYVAHCGFDLNFTPYLDQAGVHYKACDMTDWYPKKVLGFYNSMDCVLGMRGHAQMIPFGLNCEIISLGSHEKMRWFLEDIDAVDWYIELREEPEHLKDRIIETFIRIHETEPEKTRQRLLDAQEKLWNISVENAKIINGILNKDSL